MIWIEAGGERLPLFYFKNFFVYVLFLLLYTGFIYDILQNGRFLFMNASGILEIAEE